MAETETAAIDAATFLKKLDKCRAIMSSDVFTGRQKYDLIFTPELAHAMRDFPCFPEYYDPDCDYIDDVTAFYDAAESHRVFVEEMSRLDI